jgi:hypothetical protein
MKALFTKNPARILHTRNSDIAKSDPEAEKKDYYCESQEPRAETPDEWTATAVRGENHAGVKNKRQKFIACYNMFF